MSKKKNIYIYIYIYRGATAAVATRSGQAAPSSELSELVPATMQCGYT